MDTQLSVAVIGAGQWGQNLARNLFELDALFAIVDIEESRGRILAEKYGVKFYSTLDDLLLTTVPAVAIATPVFTHHQLAKKALNAKRDVFVEKPMTTTVEESDELVSLAKKNSCVLMVGQLLLYQPAIQFIKEFLREGNLGKVFSINQTRKSLGTIRKEENVLYSFGVHDLAVLEYLVNDKVDRILANAQEIISPGIADSMSILLHYSSGIQAHIHLSWLWPVRDRQLMILGEKGALYFDELQQEVVFYENFANADRTTTQKGYKKIFSDQTPPLELELKHFLDCIQNRKTPRSSGEKGREVVALMAKIMEAL